MTDKELLGKAAEYQSFSPGSGKWNEYNGLDKLSVRRAGNDSILGTPRGIPHQDRNFLINYAMG